MIFKYNDKLTVKISSEVVKLFGDWIATGDYQNESGGILIGEIQDSTHIIITDISVPQQKDRRLPFQFIRSKYGHQEIMDCLWKLSNYRKMYMGEWHTHYEHLPTPSFIDIYNWKRISNKKQNSPWILFIILGLHEFRIWTMYHGKIKELIQDA